MSDARSAPLSTSEMRKRIAAGDIFVSPIPADSAIGGNSVDLRLGKTFLLSRRSSHGVLDASDLSGAAAGVEEWHATLKDGITLQPGQFVLASTLEYLALPADVCGFIESRSTFGRMGLIAATATFVGPGYKGCPTLEIVNAGEMPVRIRPHTALCQIILLRANEDAHAPSRYQLATRPYPPRPMSPAS